MSSNKSVEKNVKKDDEFHLIETGKHGIIRIIFGRTGVIVFLLGLQIWLLYNILRYLETFIPYVVTALVIFTVIMVIYIVNSEHNSSVKISWIILFMLLPGFGEILYIFIQKDIGHRTIKKRFELIIEESETEFATQEETMNELKIENKGLYNLASYTKTVAGFPVYKGESPEYFPIGEDAFEEMLIQLKKAEKFIFMEYFIIDEGQMWGQILKVLSDKVKEGVEVRLMYDGSSELALLPHGYSKKIEELGIKCKVFAPIRPFLSTHYNYRDHRKILIVDGKIAFTGGLNLADEYINAIEVYGHWKDTAIMIQGEAVNSFTLMFLQMWNMNEKNRTYLTDSYKSKPSTEVGKGYVLPFGDSPLDSDKMGQMVYMDILNRAKDYVYIMTPYLILDGEMVTSLQFAAKRGVDVKIIMPHIPDKKVVFAQSRSYYKELIESGVEVYEYTPGFMHAKSFLSDDSKAVVGTINLDYRSLYHHFECALYMEEVSCIMDIKNDFNETLQQSQLVTLEDIKEYNFFMTLLGKMLRPFAPLM